MPFILTRFSNSNDVKELLLQKNKYILKNVVLYTKFLYYVDCKRRPFMILKLSLYKRKYLCISFSRFARGALFLRIC